MSNTKGMIGRWRGNADNSRDGTMLIGYSPDWEAYQR